MGKITGFLEHARRDVPKRPKDERKSDWREVYAGRAAGEVATQGARCMDCGVPFCQSPAGCPLGNLIPEWNDLVYRGRWDEAIERLHATNNFPEVTGRVCPAPCEQACTLNVNEDPVSIKLLEKSIADRAFDEQWVVPRPARSRTGRQVAVVGSGPAGLAGAQQLARAGHDVTLFERADRIGGLLRYGIPDFKMDKQILDRRAEQMEAEGVTIRTGCHVGVHVTACELLGQFDAVLLACGCEQPRDLPIEGRELDGVHFALDFLIQQNRRLAGDTIAPEEEILATDQRVVVLGGGDTGSDCVGTSLRQGAASVVNFELLPKPPASRAPQPPWPWWPDQLITSHAHEEGGERRWSVRTERFLGDDDGHLAGLEAVEVAWGRDPETGRPVMQDEIEDSRFTLECDLVILALGYVHPVREGLLAQLEQDGLHLTERGHIATGRSWQTSLEKVFCAGDMTRGQSLVVHAISDGRRAARAVDEYLMGASELPTGPARDLPDMLAGLPAPAGTPEEEREAAVPASRE